jgi:photosystem II stability/assembly factor-like uncharacterized protein
LIDEREVFDRFHMALNVEPQPGAFDRLQAALTQRPVTSSRRTRFVPPAPRLGPRLAAGLVAVLLTLAVAGAFLALLLTAIRTTPAKPSTTTLIGQLYDGWPRMVTSSSGWSISSYRPPGLCPDLPYSASCDFASPSSTGPFLTHTTDGGATWRSVTPSQLELHIESIQAWYFLDADHAWIAAAVSDRSLTVLATADGGRTWTAGAPVGSSKCCLTGPGGNKLAFLDGRVGWLQTSFSSSPGQHTFNLYGTTDGGRTWRLILDKANSADSTLAKLSGCTENELKFVSVNLGWISYDCIDPQRAGLPGAPGPELAVTKDGGRTWQQVLLPPYGGQTLCITSTPIFYNSNQQILFAACYNPSDVRAGVPAWLSGAHLGIYVSSDAGLSWSLRPTPPRGGAVFSDAETGWSHVWPGEKGGIDMYRTSDGGHTWKLVGSFPGGSPNSSGFLQVFDSNVAIVTAPDMNGSWIDWRTTDGGRTWVAVKRPNPSS